MKKGMTFIEMLLYAALLTIISTVVLDLFLVNANAWGNARALRNANDGGKLIMERLIQEIKLARGVNSIDSNSIEFDTSLSPTSTNPSTLLFFLDGDVLKVSRDESTGVSLNGDSFRVTNIDFQEVSSVGGNLVRIELTVESSRGKFLKTRSFTSAALLRGGF